MTGYKFVYTSLLMLALGFMVSGCGGGGSGSGNENLSITKNSTGSYDSPVITSDIGVKKIDSNGEYVIFGGGALDVTIYDEAGDKISYTTNRPMSLYLAKGKYTASIKESTNIYDDGQGIIYYKSSKIKIDSLPIDETIDLPVRSSKIYKFTLSDTKDFVISSSRIYIYIYDYELKQYVNRFEDGIVTLYPGDYYFVIDTNTFIMNGKFIISEL